MVSLSTHDRQWVLVSVLVEMGSQSMIDVITTCMEHVDDDEKKEYYRSILKKIKTIKTYISNVIDEVEPMLDKVIDPEIQLQLADAVSACIQLLEKHYRDPSKVTKIMEAAGIKLGVLNGKE